MNSKLLVAGAAVVLALLALMFVVDNHHAGAPQDPGLADSVARLAEAQLAQSQRLERLEQLLARQAGAVGSTGISPGMQGNTQAGQRNIPSPENIARAAALERSKIEQGLASEPVSPMWANRSEKLIKDFLDQRNLQKLGLPNASRSSAECHTNTCRISVAFADDDSAERTTLGLYQDLADSLPSTRSFRTELPDGSIEMVIYASTESGPPRR